MKKSFCQDKRQASTRWRLKPNSASSLWKPQIIIFKLQRDLDSNSVPEISYDSRIERLCTARGTRTNHLFPDFFSPRRHRLLSRSVFLLCITRFCANFLIRCYNIECTLRKYSIFCRILHAGVDKRTLFDCFVPLQLWTVWLHCLKGKKVSMTEDRWKKKGSWVGASCMDS